MSIGRRLKEERNRLKLNQETLGELGGVKKLAQINYEKDARAPTATYLAAIAEEGVDVTYVLTGKRVDSPLVDQTRTVQKLEELKEYIDTIIKALKA